MVFNAAAVLAVSAWKGQRVADMFGGQSGVTLLLIANNAAQVRRLFVCVCVCLHARRLVAHGTWRSLRPYAGWAC